MLGTGSADFVPQLERSAGCELACGRDVDAGAQKFRMAPRDPAIGGGVDQDPDAAASQGCFERSGLAAAGAIRCADKLSTGGSRAQACGIVQGEARVRSIDQPQAFA